MGGTLCLSYPPPLCESCIPYCRVPYLATLLLVLRLFSGLAMLGILAWDFSCCQILKEWKDVLICHRNVRSVAITLPADVNPLPPSPPLSLGGTTSAVYNTHFAAAQVR